MILRGVVEDIAIRDAAADTTEAFVGAGSASDVGLPALLEGEDGEVEVANRSETQGRRRRPSGRVVNLIRLTALPSFLEERIAAAIEPLAAGGVTVRRIQVGTYPDDNQDVFHLEGNVPDQVTLARLLFVASRAVSCLLYTSPSPRDRG